MRNPWHDLYIFVSDKKYKKANPSDNIYCFLLIRNIFHFSSIKAFFPQNCEMKQDIIKKKTDNNKNTPGNILRFKNPQNTGIMGGIERSTNLYHVHLILPIIEIQQSPYITLYISTLRNPQGPKLENEHKNLNFSHSCKFEGKQNHGLIYPEETIDLSVHM